ncbi:MAG: hypothetical protein ACXWZB_05855 [Gaiellaceae bacterium]
MHSSDFLSHLIHDRQQDRLASAAVHRLVPSSPVRSRIARSLRRTADRLDAATTISQGAPRAREISI